ncbi:MAG: extracellular solute-binding protein, partial [Chloroflexi bacterium]|nr:extracellular solute-binding protein [Chloroflexota bacterium]
MRKSTFFVVSVLVLLSMLMAACAPAQPTAAPAATQPPAAAPATATVAPEATKAAEATTPPTATVVPTVIFKGEGCAANAVPVTWYVGLGAGGDAPVIVKEQDWVKKFNTSQTDACVTLQVVHNPESYDTLKAMLASGSTPDIVGPVGKAGRASFQGAFADVSLLAKDAGFDLTKYDPALLDFTKDEGVLVGIPFALFPSFIYYDKKLFDEAKLPYPPHKVGEMYNGKPWDLVALQDLAMNLTVDKGGNDATQTGFDPKSITQFGFFEQYTDGRGIGAFFGG